MFVTHSREETAWESGDSGGGGGHAGILIRTSINLRWILCGKLCFPVVFAADAFTSGGFVLELAGICRQQTDVGEEK